MKVKKEVWIPVTRPGAAIFGVATYCSAKRPRLMQIYHEQSSSDRPAAAYCRFSEDNGRTWNDPKLLATCDKEGDRVIIPSVGPAFLDVMENRFLLFQLHTPIRADDSWVLSGLVYRRFFYQVSNDEGRTFTYWTPVIERGKEFSEDHPFKGVFMGRNSAWIANSPVKISSGEILVPLVVLVLDEKGEKLWTPYKEKNIPWFFDAVFLIGRWKGDSSLEWVTSQAVKISPTLSTEGLDEPAVAELNDGRILCICRASNYGKPDIPSYKWMAISEDNGKTWSEPEPLRYSDGGVLYSSASYSSLIHHSNGRIYWIGNISPSNPYGMFPRHPLVIAEIDEDNLGVKRETVTIIDTRMEGEIEYPFQLSNFGVYEDRETGEVVVTLPRLFPNDPNDWTAPCMKYSITV